MAQLAGFLFPQYFDNNGNPLSGGKIFAYAAGTTTPQDTYSDVAGTVPNTNPITLSSSGRTKIFLQNLSYDFVIKNSVGVTIDTIAGVGSSGSGGLSSVGTIAALRALAAGVFDYVEVGGYSAIGDGGGGLFYWSASSTAAQDFGVVIQPASSPATGRWIRLYSGPINVKWFGAKGDGSTNDTTSINTANTYVQGLANGGTLFFPGSSGAYSHASPLVFGTKVSVDMGEGARFTSFGVAITFNGRFSGGHSAHFSASVGVITFAARANEDIYAEWFGAAGDGTTDDTAALQKALSVSASGKLRLLAKTYMISSPLLPTSGWSISGSGLGTTLKSIAPISWADRGMIRLIDVTSILLQDFVVDGNKVGNATQTGPTGSETRGRSFGVEIRGLCSGITLENMRITGQQAFNNTTTGGVNGGDGVYIISSGVSDIPANVTLTNIDCDANYRQGMTVNGVTGLFVSDSIFRNTEGTNPGAGVDMEPDVITHNVTNVSFSNCGFNGNQWGVALYNTKGAVFRGISFVNCTFNENRDHGIVLEATDSGGIEFTNSLINLNGNSGIKLGGGNVDVKIALNTISKNTSNGVEINSGARNVSVSHNKISLNGLNGIRREHVSGGKLYDLYDSNSIFNNSQSSSGTYDGIYFVGSASHDDFSASVCWNSIGNLTTVGPLTQRDGVRINTNATKLHVLNNRFYANTGAPITNLGGDAVIEFNYNNNIAYTAAAGAMSLDFTAAPKYAGNYLPYIGASTANRVPKFSNTTGGLSQTLLSDDSTTLIYTGQEIQLQKSQSGGIVSIYSQNLNTAANSAARFSASVGGTAAGDAYYQASAAGGDTWSWGYDVSVSRWVLAASSALGTSNTLSVGVTGDLIVTGGIQLPAAVKTANYALLPADFLIIGDSTAGTITMTLPAVGTNKRLFAIKKLVAANTVTIAAAGSDTIDGVASINLTAIYACRFFQGEGANNRIHILSTI